MVYGGIKMALGQNYKTMKEKKEIQLTENQFNKLINNLQQIEAHKQELQKLENSQSDMLSLICEFNNIELKDIKININVETKSLIIE